MSVGQIMFFRKSTGVGCGKTGLFACLAPEFRLPADTILSMEFKIPYQKVLSVPCGVYQYTLGDAVAIVSAGVSETTVRIESGNVQDMMDLRRQVIQVHGGKVINFDPPLTVRQSFIRGVRNDFSDLCAWVRRLAR